MLISALTTIDNPFNPFTQFDEWYAWDINHGYNSCGVLARIAKTSDQLSPKEYADTIDSAIDRIIAIDFRKIFKKVTMESNEDDHF